LPGCYVLYRLAARGGHALLSRRFSEAQMQRTFRYFQRHGALTLMVPALLPPPAPFKLFVLAAGVAHSRPPQFVLAIAVARRRALPRARRAGDLLRRRRARADADARPTVAMVLVGTLVGAALFWWLRAARLRRLEQAGAR
jgi:membrane protein YqaA with SNARE-associated domain